VGLQELGLALEFQDQVPAFRVPDSAFRVPGKLLAVLLKSTTRKAMMTIKPSTAP